MAMQEPRAGVLQQRVGAHLKAIRKSRGLTIEQMAEALEVHRTYVTSLEGGRRNISLGVLERLSDALGVDPLQMLRPLADG